jgi:hypothetical protein
VKLHCDKNEAFGHWPETCFSLACMLPLLLLLLLAQDQPAFQSSIALVHVDVDVREDGHPIADLEKESFRVTDEGKPQTILNFAHEAEPLDLVLLFDARGPMRPDVKRIAETAHTALSDLRQGDRIAVMAFGQRTPTVRKCKTDLISGFTGDFEAAERSIGNQVLPLELVTPNGNGNGACGNILEGLAGAARHLLAQPKGNRRRAIIVITDDKGVPLRADAERDAVHDLWRADAVVLGVIVHSGEVVLWCCGRAYHGAGYAAEKTGGDILKTSDAAEGLREMMHRLRTRYGLYYALPPGKSGEERKIRVQLTAEAAKRHPQAVIRARSGYVVPDQ